MNTLLIKTLKAILTSLLTEAALKAVLIRLAEYFAEKSENTLDDKIVGDIKKALGS